MESAFVSELDLTLGFQEFDLGNPVWNGFGRFDFNNI